MNDEDIASMLTNHAHKKPDGKFKTVADDAKPYCQSNIICDADEDMCDCGVMCCSIHGHVDEGNDPECPCLKMGLAFMDAEDLSPNSPP